MGGRVHSWQRCSLWRSYWRVFDPSPPPPHTYLIPSLSLQLFTFWLWRAQLTLVVQLLGVSGRGLSDNIGLMGASISLQVPPPCTGPRCGGSTHLQVLEPGPGGIRHLYRHPLVPPPCPASHVCEM